MIYKEQLKSIKRQAETSINAWCNQFNNRRVKIFNQDKTLHEGQTKSVEFNLHNFSAEFIFIDNIKINVTVDDTSNIMFTD